MIRGDVVPLPAPKRAKGHEQRGRRYGVVVQSDDVPLSTVVVVPTSTRAQPASFRPEIELEGERTRVLVEQIRAIDAERLKHPPISHLRADEMRAVELAIGTILDLGTPASEPQ